MEKAFKIINVLLEKLLIIIFLVLVADVLWQVIARYAGINSSFTEELSRFLLIWLSILATAYSRSYKGQMSINFVYQKFSMKNRYRISLFIEVTIMLFALCIMVIGGINLVSITLKLGQFSPSLHLPIGLVYSVVPLSGFIIIFYSIYHIRNYIQNKDIEFKSTINTNAA